ncbi:MAG TPA: DUF1549 domain-containing protein, partial [Bryobacteraceae bacterium]|nr:DUF1549 domain-containing protein [Bryobacteraceae bacterium]
MLSRSLPVVFLLTSSVAYAADAPVSFSKDVAPIFQKSCWKCHGGAVQLSHLDLRTRESALKGGDHGPALTPGNSAQSRLYRLVSGQEKPRMPMDGQLTPEELRILESWINQGAAWENVTPRESGANALAATEEMPLPADARQFWAFRQPVRPPVPQNGASHPIDAFLLQAMEAKGLKPGPKADRRTLLRRAFLDLTGLPPTPSEAAQFLEDQAPGAWERLIDRLLASPHYGERWGRYWLDVARYADSNGFEHDFDRPNAWRYRDYVIRSYNEDKPYNRFLQEQIAGDELDQTTNETRIATGFLRSYAKVGFREKDNPQYRYEYLDDMIATIGRGVLGLTIQCARCHNHKFDPIAQKDYYSLQASLFGYVEVEQPLVPPAEAARYQQRMAEIDARIQPLRRRIREIEEPYRKALLPAKYKQFPANVQEAIATPEEHRTPGQVLLANQIIRTVSVSSSEIDTVITPADRAERQRLQEQIRAIERERPAPIPMAMAVTDGDYRFAPDGPGDEPAPGKGVKHEAIEGSFLWNGHGRYQAPPSYFLYHGDIESHGSRMQPGFVKVITYGNPPAALPPADGHTSGRRRALAEWLTSRENPLTARVEVNRIWLHHFGR